jgi:hypothetical protein
VDAGLGVWIALHTDGLARAFACAGVGLRALAAHGQSAHMPDAAITFDALQPLEIHADLTAQVAFDDVSTFLNCMDDLRKLLLGQILRADRGINVRPLKDFPGVDRTDAINVP